MNLLVPLPIHKILRLWWILKLSALIHDNTQNHQGQYTAVDGYEDKRVQAKRTSLILGVGNIPPNINCVHFCPAKEKKSMLEKQACLGWKTFA